MHVHERLHRLFRSLSLSLPPPLRPLPSLVPPLSLVTILLDAWNFYNMIASFFKVNRAINNIAIRMCSVAPANPHPMLFSGHIKDFFSAASASPSPATDHPRKKKHERRETKVFFRLVLLLLLPFDVLSLRAICTRHHRTMQIAVLREPSFSTERLFFLSSIHLTYNFNLSFASCSSSSIHILYFTAFDQSWATFYRMCAIRRESTKKKVNIKKR